MPAPVNDEYELARQLQFLTAQQVALLCGLSTDAIYRAIERGELPALRLCSRLRIRTVDFEDWMDAHTIRVRPGDSTAPDLMA